MPNYDKIAKNNKNNYAAGLAELKKDNNNIEPSDTQRAQLIAAYVALNFPSSSSSSKNDDSKSTKYSSKEVPFTGIFNVTQTNTFSSDEVTTTGDILMALKENGFNIKSQLKNVGNEVFGQLKLENQLRTDINEKIGISGQLSEGLRQEIINSYPAAIRFGYGLEHIQEMVSEIMVKSGRFNLISQETLDKSFGSARAFVGSLTDMGTAMTEFEQIGIGAGNAIDEINKAGKDSLSLGLSAKVTVKEIRENLGKINEFGFKNGVQGLAEMSRQSKEFRINMSEAFKLADKVMDPANAIDIVANLQVIGGAFGDLNDPLKLMYDATNNVEALQDSLIKAASGLATYNQEQGRFEITGINQRRVRDMAAAMGVDYRELTKSAIASQERMLANNDLMAKGFNIPEKEKEFITNLAKMDNGKMVIEIPKSLSQEFEGKSKVAIEDLTQKQIDVLEKNREQLEAMSPEEIARDQMNAITNIGRDVGGMFALQKVQAALALKGSGSGELGLNKIAAQMEAVVSNYTDEYLKGNNGLLSDDNKEKIEAAKNEVKNNVIVKSTLDSYKVMMEAYGLNNPKLKAGYDRIMEKIDKSFEKGSSPTTATTEGQTKNITFKHEFAPIPAFVDALGSSIVKNPNTFNEWAERNSNEFTTPNVAKK
jgi:hypothetical protein